MTMLNAIKKIFGIKLAAPRYGLRVHYVFGPVMGQNSYLLKDFAVTSHMTATDTAKRMSAELGTRVEVEALGLNIFALDNDATTAPLIISTLSQIDHTDSNNSVRGSIYLKERKRR